MLFGAERDHQVHYGYCEVSIPREHHKKGELETPFMRWKYFEDPRKHMVLMRVTKKTKDEFFFEISSEPLQNVKRKALIFVHGYNNSFEDAARRTAQIAHDIEFSGMPFFYSWPSTNNLLSYISDSTSVEQSIPHLKEFLSDIAIKGNFSSITLIAHSMGNRALTEAFTLLINALKKSEIKVFNEIILAAPDIDAYHFKTVIAPKLIQSNTATTLYASSNDKAMSASRTFHTAPRAGDSNDDDIVVIDGIETIDATQADTSLFGLNHSYISSNDLLLADLHHLIEKGMRACERFRLEAIPDGNNPRYWRLAK